MITANNASEGLEISSPAHCVLVMHSHSKSRQFSTPLTKFSKPEEIIFNQSGTLHGCTTIRGTGVMTDQSGPVASGAHAAAGAGRGAASRAVASPQRDSGPSTASSATGVRAKAVARQRDSPAGATVAQPDGARTSRAVAAAAAEGRGTALQAAASSSPAPGQWILDIAEAERHGRRLAESAEAAEAAQEAPRILSQKEKEAGLAVAAKGMLQQARRLCHNLLRRQGRWRQARQTDAAGAFDGRI
jgi:hypothetical protein